MTNYEKQLREFRHYMSACFEVLMDNGNDADIDSFYNSSFTITFRGKAVTIHNGAEVFQGIEEIIDSEIEEFLEEI